MQAEILMPDLGLKPGETATVSVWFAEVGEPVYEGDRLVELLIPGATYDVPSPATGKLVEILAFPDDPLQPGQVLGMVEVGEAAAEGEEPAGE
jgi:pyruvate/2-oxoglutarate dehydrogenase complex dihydrolipoamide acyltransferase (E2) component